MKVSLVIPAKGISERLENKNLYRVNGKTLVRLACEKALKCKNVHEVYLDTESDLMINDVYDLFSSGLSLIKRPKELANNQIGANELMIFALHSIEECDLLLQSFSTSPLITAQTIDRCIEEFVESQEGFDSFFTVIPVQEYFWNTNMKPINFSTKELPNSINLEKIFMETHGLYGIYTESLLKCRTRVGKKNMLIEIPKLEALDVDDDEDIKILEAIYGAK